MKRTGATSWVLCPECYPDEPRLRDQVADRLRWASKTVDSPGEWNGSVRAVLRERPRTGFRRGDVRRRAAHGEADNPGTVAELRRTAERWDVQLLGLEARGPVHSRPAWEQECADADRESRLAWRAYADAVYRDL